MRVHTKPKALPAEWAEKVAVMSSCRPRSDSGVVLTGGSGCAPSATRDAASRSVASSGGGAKSTRRRSAGSAVTTLGMDWMPAHSLSGPPSASATQPMSSHLPPASVAKLLLE